jgi:Protein of unknown function (DUF1501)
VKSAHYRQSRLVSRRDVLRIGGGLAIANGLASFARASERVSSKSCIFIYLLGGPPQLDTFDLKPDAPAEVRGPFNPIAASVPGLRICEHLPKLARLAHKYAIVRTVSHNNHNHTPMIYYTLTGRSVERPGEDNDVRPPQRTDHPHIGSVLAKHMPSPRGLPGYIAIPEAAVRSSLSGEFKRVRSLLRGGGGGFLGPLVDPLAVNGDPGTADAIPALSSPKDVAGERFEQRSKLLAILDQRSFSNTSTQNALRSQAVSLTGASGGTKAFSLDGEPLAVRERYGNHRFGRAMLLARRLSEAGVPMTAIHFNEMTICDGWDTHSKNFPALKDELLPMVDQSVSALIEDLDQRGRLGETLIVMMGEFGRTPKINGNGGRDHWGLCQSVLLAGCGIQGGQVIGTSDKIGAYPVTDAIDPTDIHATMFHCLGLDPEAIMYDSLKRPYVLCTGQVVRGLL